MKIKKETYLVVIAIIGALSLVGGYWLIIDNIGILPALGIFLILLSESIGRRLKKEDELEEGDK